MARAQPSTINSLTINLLPSLRAFVSLWFKFHLRSLAPIRGYHSEFRAHMIRGFLATILSFIDDLFLISACAFHTLRTSMPARFNDRLAGKCTPMGAAASNLV